MSKPVRNYFILNIVFITLFFSFIITNSAQVSNKSGDSKTNIVNTKVEDIDKEKDSLLLVFKNEKDKTIEAINDIPNHKKGYLKLRKQEQKAYEDFIKTVQTYIDSRGKNEVVIFDKDIKKKLNEGELLLIKDSICVEYKKKFLSNKPSKVCKKFEYVFYLKDNKGQIIETL